MGTIRAIRWNALIGATALTFVAASTAVATYYAGRNAAVPPSDPSTLVWLGPKGPALEEAIGARLQTALVTLDDPHHEAAGRVPAYRSELQIANALLRRAVLANLADTRAIQRLAAVGWELGIFDGALDEEGLATLVAVAGARAPRVPGIQVELGDILYKLGRSDDAKPFMSRAVSLSASTASRVVAIMVGAGVDPLEILRTLPPAPEVLTALMPEFLSRGRGAEFLSVLEERMRIDPAKLLATYGDLALSLQQAERLRSHFTALGRLEDTHSEAERLFQLGRASARFGEWEAAYRLGMNAVSLWPADPRYCEFSASAAMESNHLSEAETVLRDGISRLAVLDGTSGWRARLYRGLGDVYERMGKGDEALVFYRRALEQDPWEPAARARVAQVESLLAPKAAHHP